MIRRLHHVQITVAKANEAAARKFYLEELGLEEVEKPEALKRNGGFWISLADLQIHVGIEEGFDRTQTKSHLAYQVDDYDQWENKIKSLGLKVQRGEGIPHCRRFEFRDPFGNRLEIISFEEK